HFIHFLAENLKSAIGFFEQYKSPSWDDLRNKREMLNSDMNRMQEAAVRTRCVEEATAKEDIKLQRDFMDMVALRLHAQKLSRIMEALQPKKREPEVGNLDPLLDTNRSVHEIVVELNEVRSQRNRELVPLDARAQKLSDLMECATFDAINDALARGTYPYQRQSITEYERTLENSQQLAQEIRYGRSRLEEELAKLETAHKQKKETILSIRDQLCGLSKRESEISAELTQKRDELYAQLAELTQMKHIELSYMDRNAMEAAKAMIDLPQKQQAYRDHVQKLEELKRDLMASVYDLDPSGATQSEGSAAKKLSKIAFTLKNIRKWIGNSTKITEESQQKRRRKRTLEPFKGPELYTPFMEGLGNRSVFIEDVSKLLMFIESSLNE
ncbi:MAG TPA: hypothetical protein O0W88_05015, partial [Methanocorpusculum sp.]|nr:hypothetical protein [Methanocorpusculum sp.]